MVVPINTPLLLNNNNNPSKEIWASSGIYDQKAYKNPPIYYPDASNSLLANTGISVTTSSTTQPPENAYQPHSDHTFRIVAPGRTPPLNKVLLSDSNYFIDDMLVFNDYIHYDDKKPVRFNPQAFLEAAVVSFNIYSMEYRT